MAKLPDRAEAQRQFLALPMSERRAIMRAVNRGRAVEVRKHAPIAVGVAQRQQRFWRYAWLLGPAIAAVQVAFVPVEVVLLNAGLATVVLAGMAYWWHGRAKRSEVRNREVAQGTRAPGRGNDHGSSRGHLPGQAGRATATRQDDTEAAAHPTVPGQRPYKPRGRKRRSR